MSTTPRDRAIEIVARGGRSGTTIGEHARAAVDALLERPDLLRELAGPGAGTAAPWDAEQVCGNTTGPQLDALPRGNDQCCDEACNGGACETCRCCAAGWCVTGADGLPEDPVDLAGWIEVARKHNPIVEAWAVDRAELARLRAQQSIGRAEPCDCGHPRREHESYEDGYGACEDDGCECAVYEYRGWES